MKAKVKNINDSLKEVHKRFLELERIQAENFFQRKISPFEFVQMLTQDRNFAWLQPFSALIAEIDAFADDAEFISEEDVIGIKNKIQAILKETSRYNDHMAHDAAFIMFHSSLKKELNIQEFKND